MNRELKSYLYSKEPKDVELAHIALGYALASVENKVSMLVVIDTLSSTMLVSTDKLQKYSKALREYLNKDAPLDVYASTFYGFLGVDNFFVDTVELIDNDIYAFTSLYREAKVLVGGIDV